MKEKIPESQLVIPPRQTEYYSILYFLSYTNTLVTKFKLNSFVLTYLIVTNLTIKLTN